MLTQSSQEDDTGSLSHALLAIEVMFATPTPPHQLTSSSDDFKRRSLSCNPDPSPLQTPLSPRTKATLALFAIFTELLTPIWPKLTRQAMYI